jgi:hypothetical protein
MAFSYLCFSVEQHRPAKGHITNTGLEQLGRGLVDPQLGVCTCAYGTSQLVRIELEVQLGTQLVL